jgi:hypothetical protein
MSTMQTLIHEVEQAPDAMLEEVLDFVRFLKAGRFAQTPANGNSSAVGEVEVIFDRPRTLHDLANEQRTFLASVSTPLVDVDLPSEE